MAVFTTREAAGEFVKGDPFVHRGVARSWTIREWNEALVPTEKWIAGPRQPPASAGPAGRDTETGAEQAGRDRGAWTDIEPALHPEPYVSVTVCELPPDVQPFAAIREDEGLTLVLTRDQADRAGLPA